MIIFYYVVFILLGYLSGSLLWSRIIAKVFCGHNIVEENSDKNPGAANVFKTCGVPAGIAALICDLLKGFLPVFISFFFVPTSSFLFSLLVSSPVLGHIFSIFFRFKGGKAIAVSFGVLLALSYMTPLPLILLIVLYIFFSLIVVFKPHVWRSVVVYVLFGFLSALFVDNIFAVAACVIIAVAVFLRHYITRDRNDSITVTLFPRASDDSKK